MTDERKQQIETLATKLMGWEIDYMYDIPGNWNPFENPADCEMVKAKLDEKYFIQITRYKKVCADAKIETEKFGEEWRAEATTEYEAVCMAALQLPECEENENG